MGSYSTQAITREKDHIKTNELSISGESVALTCSSCIARHRDPIGLQHTNTHGREPFYTSRDLPPMTTYYHALRILMYDDY